MPGHEERQLRQEKRRLKRQAAKRTRSQVRQALLERDYEQAAAERALSARETVDQMHIGEDHAQRQERRARQARRQPPATPADE